MITSVDRIDGPGLGCQRDIPIGVMANDFFSANDMEGKSESPRQGIIPAIASEFVLAAHGLRAQTGTALKHAGYALLDVSRSVGKDDHLFARDPASGHDRVGIRGMRFPFFEPGRSFRKRNAQIVRQLPVLK
jgi:hypothetical protein